MSPSEELTALQSHFFQMATFDGISAEDLGDAIKDEAHSNVVLLVDLWVRKSFALDLVPSFQEEMGLSEEEVKERFQTVASKVCSRSILPVL